MAPRVGNYAFDCDDVMKVAEFWSAVLERPLDPISGPDYASIGGSDPERPQPAWYFEKVPEPKVAKNRMHLDLIDPDPSAVERLVSLGATVVQEHRLEWASHSWTVMQDPEGNEFCIADRTFTG